MVFMNTQKGNVPRTSKKEMRKSSKAKIPQSASFLSPPHMEEAVPVAHTKFRLQGRAIFLTWPQNAATKEDTLAACVQQWPSATFIVVAEEEHKTGDPHLHAVIQFEKRVDMKDCMPMLDALTGKHGNYQNVRSAKRVLKYVCKGGNFISHGDVPDLEDKEKLQDGVAKMIMEGETYKDVVARTLALL